jgi:hypothetical protein
VYYSGTDPIYIQVSLINNSANTFYFRLAGDRIFSLDFDVRTMRNRPVEPSDNLLSRRAGSGQVFFRDVAIEPGESFLFVENLLDFADIKEPGSYVAQAKFYPRLYANASFSDANGSGGGEDCLVSPRLTVNLRPPLLVDEDGLPQQLDVETNAKLVREGLPPDEVVAFTLTARQKSQWEKFFLYIDLEQMLLRDAARERRFRSESEEGRARMVERFRNDMRNSIIDGDISAIPSSFEIERTSYGPEEGTVVVLERFNQGGYTEKKRYTYHLKKYGDIWSIVDYVVMNLGTE